MEPGARRVFEALAETLLEALAETLLEAHFAQQNAGTGTKTGHASPFRYNPKSILVRTPHMGNRLSKIVTRTGDAGTTGLGDGSRVAKDSLRIEAMGEVDELNSTIGLLLTEDLPASIREALTGIQHDLFDLGGELCIPGMNIINDAHITRLEDLVEQFNDGLAPLKEFILPGGTRAAAFAHLSRTVARRAERRIVHLANNENVSEFARKYLNRISDLMFVLGRALNQAGGQPDVLWVHGKNRKSAD
jgi:cob(I)alamin adenosyltransferase